MTHPYGLPPPTPAPVEEQVDHDFDAAWAERRAKAPRVRVLGRVYRLPRSAPAKIILFMARNKDRPDQSLNPDELIEMLGCLLGGVDNVHDMLSNGLEMDELEDVMRYCLSSYKSANAGAEAGGQGEAQAPATGITPSV